METIKKLSDLNKKYLQPVVALGMFDGVHVGHASVINHAKEISKKIGGTLIVFTFSNHPLSIISPEKTPLSIGSRSLRREIFESLGVEVLIEIPFTKEFSRKSPEEFLELLRDKITPAYVVTGPNYTFGRFGKGNGRMLLREGKNFGFDTEICPAVTSDKKNVSSTRIRALIAEGLWLTKCSAEILPICPKSFTETNAAESWVFRLRILKLTTTEQCCPTAFI